MKNIVETLKTLKLKVTPARIAILEIFSISDKPLSVEIIAKRMKDKQINQVTIYRTIESLVSAGIVGRIDLRRDAIFYELIDEHHHHHIVCTKCGLLEDFETCQIEEVSKNIILKSKKFKMIQDHSFELFGICNSCSRKNV
ncbi:MAG: ferric uptake regulator, Fur family [Candidatus Taylorbacteria bacterium]|nr:ferric uptake regulator, Fur family [Candidatus Taylorbacteria bacterium]